MPSVFDELYIELFAHSCTKEGQAFERIAAAVSKLVFPQADVAHDQKLRGQISNSLYQIDVKLNENGHQSFGEAKDYTVQGKKVGRGDVQKLAGALLEVNARKGVFYSATGYTSPAKKYAKGAEAFLNKPIDLLHIRPSVQTDEEGRVRKFVINIHISLPDYANASFSPIWSPSAQCYLSKLLDSQRKSSAKENIAIDTFFDIQGQPTITVSELTSQGFGGDFEIAQGCFVLANQYVKVEGMLLELRGLEYKVPFLRETRVVEIEGSGTPRILIKAEDETINRLVTDEQLKKISFDENGEVI